MRHTARIATEAARAEAIQEAKARAATIVEQKANYLNAELEVAMAVSQTLADTFTGIKDERLNLNLDRDSLKRWIRSR